MQDFDGSSGWQSLLPWSADSLARQETEHGTKCFATSAAGDDERLVDITKLVSHHVIEVARLARSCQLVLYGRIQSRAVPLLQALQT